jgi:hypothetical protein
MFSVAVVSLFGFEFDFVLNCLAGILYKLMVLFGLTPVRHCCNVSEINKCLLCKSFSCTGSVVHFCPHHFA